MKAEITLDAIFVEKVANVCLKKMTDSETLKIIGKRVDDLFNHYLSSNKDIQMFIDNSAHELARVIMRDESYKKTITEEITKAIGSIDTKELLLTKLKDKMNKAIEDAENSKIEYQSLIDELE